MPAISRYIPLPGKAPSAGEDWEAINKEIVSALIRDVRQVQRAADEARPNHRDSIYTGISGIAFMEHQLAGMDILLQDHNVAPRALAAAADKHLAKVLHNHPINMEYMYSPVRLSFLESSIGVATLVLCRGLCTTEQAIIDACPAAKEYLQYAVERTLASDKEDYTPADKDDGCEVLYGRAGLIYALLYLRKSIQGQPPLETASLEELLSDENLSRLIDSVMMRGRHGARILSSEFRVSEGPGLPPLMWMWHGKRYLGGAHGVAGILQILLLCPIGMVQKHLVDIFGTISWLIGCQDESGNWPSKCPNQHDMSGQNDLVQWCHGASGIAILLSTALRVLQNPTYAISRGNLEESCRHSLRLGANYVYKHGLLRKGVGLCHGGAGSVYALLAATDALDTSTRKEFFAKAAHLAFLITLHDDMQRSKEMLIPDHPWSVYEGLAGACFGWAEILCRLDSKDPRRRITGFPGYDDLLWD